MTARVLIDWEDFLPDFLEMGREAVERHVEVFRNEPRLCSYGHELRVAGPSLDDMHVVVIGDACSGNLPEVHPDV